MLSFEHAERLANICVRLGIADSDPEEDGSVLSFEKFSKCVDDIGLSNDEMKELVEDMLQLMSDISFKNELGNVLNSLK